MSCPPPKPPGKPSVEFEVKGADPAPPNCEFTHDICVQCGTRMDLIKTKWICPKCRWIVGCCD